MPKKGTKKIYSMRRRTKQTQRQRQNRLKSLSLVKQLRERSIRQARSQKEKERILNTNNTTHTVPIKAIPVSIVENTSNNGNNLELNKNGIYTPYPVEYKSLGQSRKGKTIPVKQLSNKQRQQQMFAFTRKQREQARRRAREEKQEERVFENAELVNQGNISNESNTVSMTTEEWYNEMARREAEEEAEFRRLEEEHEREALQKATVKMNQAEKNKFYIRINDKTMMKAIDFKNYISYTTPWKFEVLWLDQNPAKSYYYIYKWDPDYSNNFSDYGYGYNSNYNEEGYNMYSKSPAYYFKPVFIPHRWNFYGPNENDDYNVYNAKFEKFFPRHTVRRHIPKLPHFKEQVEKELLAKATAPAKLQQLQLKGLEGWIEQMEQQTGKQMPRNVQNIIERSIKPIDYRYYQGRDNLQRIQTNVIQTQANNGKQVLRKINTSLFQE